MFVTGDYEGMGDADLRQHLIDGWYADKDVVEKYDILAASGWLGGYEEDAWFLLRDRGDGQLFEVTGSHCSCHGFEDQFEPAVTTEKYLLSDNFSARNVDVHEFQKWFSEHASN